MLVEWKVAGAVGGEPREVRFGLSRLLLSSKRVTVGSLGVCGVWCVHETHLLIVLHPKDQINVKKHAHGAVQGVYRL